MIDPIIYVDDCHTNVERRVLSELGIPVIRRINIKAWNINDAMGIICDPRLILSVINQINEVSVMEIALLHFMCKPILVTHRAIEEYPVIEKCVDFIDYTSNMMDDASTFINWYKWWESQ